MPKKLITIFEHDFLIAGQDDDSEFSYRDGIATMPKQDFKALADFVKDINAKTQNDENIESWLLKPARKDRQDALKAAQFVGIVQFKDGVIVEILPKLYRPQTDVVKANEQTNSRDLLCKMLKTLKDARFKSFNSASLAAQKMHLLDIFVMMFLNELDAIIKQGIRSKYIPQEGNLNYFKGKLLVSQNISKNYGLLHKTYMQYDDYLPDIPENRLIKSTLVYLLKTVSASALQKRVRENCFIFDDVPLSTNYKLDYSQSAHNSRLFSHYQALIEWCNTFLAGHSFVTQHGHNSVKALFFDMNKLFESYVGAKLKIPEHSDFKSQHNQHSLAYSCNAEHFGLKPDFVFKKCGVDNKLKLIIADSKWKIIRKQTQISQSDLYQMFAYYQRYKAIELQNKEDTSVAVWLIYPYHSDLVDLTHEVYKKYNFEQKLTSRSTDIHLEIKFFDCEKDTLVIDINR